MRKIHKTAIVDPSAQIGDNVVIGPYAIVESDTIIEDNCRIAGFATIAQYTHMASGCTLFPHAVVGTIPQDLKFKGEKTFLNIGKNTTFREFCMINRGTVGGGGVTTIGNNCLIMAYAHVAHDCILGNNIILANGATLAGHITIENHAIIGGLVAVHQFARIGKYAMVGGSSGVPQDILPFCLSGDPRATLHGINRIGLARHNFTKLQIDNLTKAYRILFMEKNMLSDALYELKNLYAADLNIAYLVKFIENTKRGFCRPARR